MCAMHVWLRLAQDFLSPLWYGFSICRLWNHIDVKFTTSKISHDEWENELHVAEKTRPKGEGGGHEVKLLCGETVCKFKVKGYRYLPGHYTKKDSEQWYTANGLFLRKYSGVDPNWLQF